MADFIGAGGDVSMEVSNPHQSLTSASPKPHHPQLRLAKSSLNLHLIIIILTKSAPGLLHRSLAAAVCSHCRGRRRWTSCKSHSSHFLTRPTFLLSSARSGFWIDHFNALRDHSLGQASPGMSWISFGCSLVSRTDWHHQQRVNPCALNAI